LVTTGLASCIHHRVRVVHCHGLGEGICCPLTEHKCGKLRFSAGRVVFADAPSVPRPQNPFGIGKKLRGSESGPSCIPCLDTKILPVKTVGFTFVLSALANDRIGSSFETTRF